MDTSKTGVSGFQALELLIEDNIFWGLVAIKQSDLHGKFSLGNISNHTHQRGNPRPPGNQDQFIGKALLKIKLTGAVFKGEEIPFLDDFMQVGADPTGFLNRDLQIVLLCG